MLKPPVGENIILEIFPLNIWSHYHWMSLSQKHLLKKSSQPGPPTGASFRGFRGFCKAGATLAVKERQSSASWLSHFGGVGLCPGAIYHQILNPWKLTAGTWKWWFSKGISFSRGPLLGSMLVFGGVIREPLTENLLSDGWLLGSWW